jgi:hypothetical protein
MKSTERKSSDPVHGQFLAVPDEIIAGGLSYRFVPTIRINTFYCCPLFDDPSFLSQHQLGGKCDATFWRTLFALWGAYPTIQTPIVAMR